MKVRLARAGHSFHPLLPALKGRRGNAGDPRNHPTRGATNEYTGHRARILPDSKGIACQATIIGSDKPQVRASRQGIPLTESGARTFTAYYSFVLRFVCFKKRGACSTLNRLRHALERELVPFAIALLIAQLWF